MVDPVYQGIGAGETAVSFQCRAHEASFQTCLGRRAGKSGHLDVAKTVQRESGLPHFRAFSLQNVGVGLFGRQIGPPIQSAIVIHSSGMPQRHPGAPRPGCAKSRPTGEVLAEVIDVDVFRRFQNPHRLDGLHHFDRRHHLGGQDSARRLHRQSPVPIGIVVVRSRPAGLLQSSIVDFTRADLVCKDGPPRGFPRLVADNAHSLTIGEFQVHLEDQLRSVAVWLSSNRRCSRAVPTVPQQHAQGIATTFEPSGNVVGYVQRASGQFEGQVIVVVGRGRVENVVADFAPVEIQFVISQAREVNSCLFDVLLEREFLP